AWRRAHHEAAVGLHVVAHPPDVLERGLAEDHRRRHPILLPVSRPRLEDGTRGRVVREALHHELAGFGPGRRDRDLAELNERHRGDEPVGLERLLLPGLAEAHADAGVAPLDAGHGAAETDPIAELRGEGVWQGLVAALDAEDLGWVEGHAAELQEAGVPDRVE